MPVDAVRTRRSVSRGLAAGCHLLISLVVTALVFLIMISLWYPWPIFLAAGALELLLLVSLCDVVLGPSLTFVAFKPGKRGLKFDLTVIALLQLGALAYGVHTVYLARPVFNIFAIDRFELVSQAEIDRDELVLAPEAYRSLSRSGPKLVGAVLPSDPGERSTLLMAAATQGIDIRHLPKYYVPYDDLRVAGLAKSAPIEHLSLYNDPAKVKTVLAELGFPVEELRYFPMQGAKRDLSVIVNGQTGTILRIVNLWPWPR